MNLSVDSNVLVRAMVQDDPNQGRAAAKLLHDAELIAVALPCLCELVRVLRRVYGFTSQDVAEAIRALMATSNVAMNRPAVEAGLAMLNGGGDFADGVIAWEGHWLGGDAFVAFDKWAAALLMSQGFQAQAL